MKTEKVVKAIEHTIWVYGKHRYKEFIHEALWSLTVKLGLGERFRYLEKELIE